MGVHTAQIEGVENTGQRRTTAAFESSDLGGAVAGLRKKVTRRYGLHLINHTGGVHHQRI